MDDKSFQNLLVWIHYRHEQVGDDNPKGNEFHLIPKGQRHVDCPCAY